MKFDWDDAKSECNLKKHGVSFELARLVFDDPHNVSQRDETCETEERWLTIGLVEGILILLLVHTWEEEDHEEIVRIISARKATRVERETYENQYKKP
jgi:uncharacterized DUF497 family protein